MKTFKLPASKCPVCGAPSNRATSLSAAKPPSAGDIGLCVCCGEILEYDEKLNPIQASLTNLMLVPEEQRQQLFKAQECVWARRCMRG